VDKRFDRFKFCDSRLFPYLEKVMDRLPDEVKEALLNNHTLQILADENALYACAVQYAFDQPIESLIYLNPKILMESEHLIICIIACEVAHHVLSKGRPDLSEEAVADLLIDWGFEKEVKTMRYERTVTQSEGYRAGYNWARKQSQDYLMQHFGLYFDEWNEKGLINVSSEALDVLPDKAKSDSTIDEMIRLEKEAYIESEEDKVSETLSLRKTMLAGIMAAVKELKLSEICRPENCVTRHSAYKTV